MNFTHAPGLFTTPSLPLVPVTVPAHSLVASSLSPMAVARFGDVLLVTGRSSTYGTTATYCRSTDGGVTWSARTFPSANFFYNIAASDTTIVVASVNVGQSGVGYYTSTDAGLTWTTRTFPLVPSSYMMTYGAGLFVLSSQVSSPSSSVYTSPDGITWTQRPLPLAAQWIGVFYCDNIFVCINYNSITNGHKIVTSPDGITWTLRTLASTSGTISGQVQRRWAAGGNGILMVGQDTSSGITAYYDISTDGGVSWTSYASPATQGFTSGLFHNGAFYAHGYGATDVWYKTVDGITWTTINAGSALQYYTGVSGPIGATFISYLAPSYATILP